LGIVGNLTKGFASHPTIRGGKTSIRLVIGSFRATVDVPLELVVHESLVAPLEDRKIFEFFEVPADVLGGDKESSEEHEWDDEDGGEGHSHLLVGETGGYDQGVAGGGVVDQDKSQEEGQEGAEVGVEANEPVDDAAEDGGSHDREGKLRDDLGPEVGSRVVHVVADFTEENGALIGEDEDNVLDGVEGDVHGDEEEGTLLVLNTGFVESGIVEKKHSEDSGHASGEQLHVGGLGKTEQVEEVSAGEEVELEEERGLNGDIDFVSGEGSNIGVLGSGVVLEIFGGLVVAVQNINLLSVLGLDLRGVVSHGSDGAIVNLELDVLDGHNGHEVIGGVGEVGAIVANALEVVNGEVGFVKVDDLTTSEEQEAIENLETVGVGLMDSGEDSSLILFGQVEEDLHDVGGGEGVQTGGGLVKEDQGGVRDQLHTDGGSLTFSTGDTLHEGATNLSVLALHHLEVVDDVFDSLHLGFCGDSTELELSSELEALTDGHGLEKNIVLLHVRGVGGEVGQIVLVGAVDENGSLVLEVGGFISARQEVKQSCFTGT